MPATINGIGTHYYGAKNRSARVDTCKQCGRSATLSSYDTREWFCILFIPLVPIKKYRILNDCSRCRKHFRIAQDEFGKKLAEATAPIRREMRATPSDPELHLKLIHTLMAWEMRTEATRELDVAMKAFPQNASLMVLAAQLAVDTNDFPRATSMYERAYAIDPANPGVTYGYGWVLQHLEQWEKAIPILQRAASQDANKKGAIYLLGKSHMKLQHWNEALNSFQQLLSIEPAYMKDKAFMRLVRECKQHLGYQLTDAERRAGRSWWPFGGGTKKRATLQGAPTLVRPSIRYAGIALAIVMAFSLGFYAWDKWTNLPVWFDNGLDKSVKVDLDHQNFDIALNSLHKEEMSAGPHTVVVHDAKSGKELERMTFTLDKLNPLAALMHERFFVYNVGGRHVYRRANVGYAEHPETASYSSDLVAMQRFFEERDVDYAFTTPPETIEADAGSGVVHKVSFDVARDLDLRKYAVLKLQQGKTKEAQEAIDRAVTFAPCDAPTRRTEINMAAMNGTFEKANDAAKHWIADCTQDDLDAHRAYQDLNRENGRYAELRDEYQKLVAASPQSGKAHYLYGRVAADPQIALAEYQQAIQLEPALVWPRVALGHTYQAMERFDDAIGEFRAALDMKGCDPSVVTYYANAAVAKGQPQDAADKVEERVKANKRDRNALYSRWLLATASANWDRAAETEKALEPLQTRDAAWWLTTKRMRIKQDSSFDDRLASGMKSKELEPIALNFVIERAIETGEYARSADLVARNLKDLDPITAAMFEAYAAGGLILQHDSAGALKLLDDAHKMMADAPKGSAQRVTLALVEGLRGTMTPEAVLSVARENDAPQHGWFVSAVRAAQSGDRNAAAESLAKCARASSDLEFPYLEAKAMAARLR